MIKMNPKDISDLLKNPELFNEFLQFINQKIENKKEIKQYSNEELISNYIELNQFRNKKIYRFNILNFIKFLQNHIEKKEWKLQEITQFEIDQYKIYLEKNNRITSNYKKIQWIILVNFYRFYENQSKNGKYYFKEFPIFNSLRLNPSEKDIERKEQKLKIFDTQIMTVLYLNGLLRLNFKFYLIERLKFESGMRTVDALRLKKKFLFLDERYCYTEGRKGFRCYYLSQELVKDIQKYLDNTRNNESELLFISNKKQKYSTDGYFHSLFIIYSKMNFLEKRISGRKTFATIRYKYMNQSKAEISSLMGHKIKNVTDRYIELEHSDYLKMFDKYNYLKWIYLPDAWVEKFLFEHKNFPKFDDKIPKPYGEPLSEELEKDLEEFLKNNT